MASLTHGQRRAKQRRSTPTAKRRRAKTSKLRVRRIKLGLRRKKMGINHPSSDPVHKARKPGAVRASRMPGGSSFRGQRQWDAHHG